MFSLPFDEARYQKTLEVCALVSDLAILEDGDESEIGERGVNLSGGQKARGLTFPFMFMTTAQANYILQFPWPALYTREPHCCFLTMF